MTRHKPGILIDGPFFRPHGRLKTLWRRLWHGLMSPLGKLKGRGPAPPPSAAPPAHPLGWTARLACAHGGTAPRLARYHGLESCRLAAGHDDGPLLCPYGCVGYGDCALACPWGAITFEGFPQVDETLCNGCGVCARICPKGLWRLGRPGKRAFIACASLSGLKKNAEYCQKACLGCARCLKACPAGAIGRESPRGAFTIDEERCQGYGPGCGRACAAACPRGLLGPPEGDSY